MGQQLNKIIKRRRRKAYLERKKAQATKTQESFLALRPEAKEYLAGLMATELHVQSHLAKIQAGADALMTLKAEAF